MQRISSSLRAVLNIKKIEVRMTTKLNYRQNDYRKIKSTKLEVRSWRFIWQLHCSELFVSQSDSIALFFIR